MSTKRRSDDIFTNPEDEERNMVPEKRRKRMNELEQKCKEDFKKELTEQHDSLRPRVLLSETADGQKSDFPITSRLKANFIYLVGVLRRRLDNKLRAHGRDPQNDNLSAENTQTDVVAELTNRIDAVERLDSNVNTQAKFLEKFFTGFMQDQDWFGENELLKDDSNYDYVSVVPTHELDDNFNHVDAICTISNEYTGHKLLPFGIDFTCASDPNTMEKKFSHVHGYGSTNKLPEGRSEFDSRAVAETKGLHIPGFTSAVAYANHDADGRDPRYSRIKGRIRLMPILKVGSSIDLVKELREGIPTLRHNGDKVSPATELDEEFPGVYRQREREFLLASKKAKWCCLRECKAQADDLNYQMEHLEEIMGQKKYDALKQRVAQEWKEEQAAIEEEIRDLTEKMIGQGKYFPKESRQMLIEMDEDGLANFIEKSGLDGKDVRELVEMFREQSQGDLLEQAKEQARSLKAYFDRVWEIANQRADGVLSPSGNEVGTNSKNWKTLAEYQDAEQKARETAEKDRVCNLIVDFSRSTYRGQDSAMIQEYKLKQKDYSLEQAA